MRYAYGGEKWKLGQTISLANNYWLDLRRMPCTNVILERFLRILTLDPYFDIILKFKGVDK